MPIIDKFKDMGTTVMGKVESGSVREGDSLLIMPNKVPVLCLLSILRDLLVLFYAKNDSLIHWYAGSGEGYCYIH